MQACQQCVSQWWQSGLNLEYAKGTCDGCGKVGVHVFTLFHGKAMPARHGVGAPPPSRGASSCELSLRQAGEERVRLGRDEASWCHVVVGVDSKPHDIFILVAGAHADKIMAQGLENLFGLIGRIEASAHQESV